MDSYIHRILKLKNVAGGEHSPLAICLVPASSQLPFRMSAPGSQG